MALTIQETINAHITDTNNPHNVTKEDLGLGLVQNFLLPTNDEALSGSIPNRYVTPAQLKLVFDGLLKREGLMDDLGNVTLP